MNRRDFLFCRTEPRRRVVEVSCRRLHLRCLERLATATPAAGEAAADGEPAADFRGPSIHEVCATIGRELGPGDTLRVVERDWLRDAALARAIDALADGHRRRGGAVDVTP